MKKLTYLFVPLLLFSCGNNNIQNDLEQNENSFIQNENSSIIQDNNQNDNISIEDNIKPLKPISIYLNPSVQVKNIYYDQKTTEAYIMNEVSKEIYQALNKKEGFIVYANHNYLQLKDSIKESNSLKVDYHLALHTNAGGGKGSEAFYYKNNYFAKLLLDKFNSTHKFTTRGIKQNSSLYELKNSTAKNVALIEFLFHDNPSEGYYLKTNIKSMANAIVEVFDQLLLDHQNQI